MVTPCLCATMRSKRTLVTQQGDQATLPRGVLEL